MRNLLQRQHKEKKEHVEKVRDNFLIAFLPELWAGAHYEVAKVHDIQHCVTLHTLY